VEGLVPLALANGWASGISAYGVVFLMGLIGRLGWADTPELLRRTDVLVVAGLLAARSASAWRCSCSPGSGGAGAGSRPASARARRPGAGRASGSLPRVRVLRTPETSFEALPGFPHEPRYAEVPDGDGGGGELRMAWVEAGPPDGPVVLLLHGEPTWSFLYRSMLPILADSGFRAVAPDLVGFGRSDKPADVADHSYARHVEWLRALVVDRLDLSEVTLVCQDWGGLLGLRLVAAHPERFARVVASNTALPTGDQAMPEVWLRFRETVRTASTLDIGRFVAGGCARGLSDADRAGYDAPFPDPSYTAGPRALPSLVPATPDDPAAADNRAAWAALCRYDKPFLTAFTDSDPITAGGDAPMRTMIPGAAGLEHPTINGAGHFVQEDAGPELARIVVALARAT